MTFKFTAVKWSLLITMSTFKMPNYTVYENEQGSLEPTITEAEAKIKLDEREEI